MSITAKKILDTALTAEGMFSNISNYFISSELHVQENIKILNSLLNELVSSVNFNELLEELSFRTYSQWTPGVQVNADMWPVYVLSNENSMEGLRYKATSTGISTVSPATLNLKKGQSGITSDGIGWVCLGDWCEYNLSELFPDYKSLKPSTLVDYSRKLPMTAITDEIWQRNKMYQVRSYTGYYQLRGDRLFLFPGYADGTVISGFYYSKLPVKDTDGIRKDEVNSNTDVVLLPDLLMTTGVAYKWLKDKGLAGTYEELEKTYNDFLLTYQAISKSGKVINLGGGCSNYWKPLPDGDWNIVGY